MSCKGSKGYACPDYFSDAGSPTFFAKTAGFIELDARKALAFILYGHPKDPQLTMVASTSSSYVYISSTIIINEKMRRLQSRSIVSFKLLPGQDCMK